MPTHVSGRVTTTPGLLQRLAELPLPVLFPLFFAAVALSHLTLLRLPYFWDEAGYYVPAALDFYHTGTLVPQFTNAHPPLPNVVLGTLWHVFGYHFLVTRLTACTFAAAGLLAVFELGKGLLGPRVGFTLALLTAAYPIWFAQSSLAHADIFTAAFSLAGIALFLSAPELSGNPSNDQSSRRRLFLAALCFCLSVLSKETAILQPATLGAVSLSTAFRKTSGPHLTRAHRRWLLAFSCSLPVLIAWYGYHYAKTGLVFGNPVYLRYNATANFTVAHVLYALRIRFIHLVWQRNLWVPLVLALACFLLPRTAAGLPQPVVVAIGALISANLLAFSFLGGALLTRYLLPVYPLILLLCLSVWRERTVHWPWLAGLTAVAFVTAIWANPWAFFAPEDNLTYRNMVVVQQEAIHFIDQHYPAATILTAWPASAELFRPELGYTARRYKVYSLEEFSRAELAKAAQEPGRYDTALVFATHYLDPSFRHFLVTHPDSWRGRRYASQLDLTPSEIAGLLGGRVAWQDDRNGEWAAVIRFDRSYQAHAVVPVQGTAGSGRPSGMLREACVSPGSGLR